MTEPSFKTEKSIIPELKEPELSIGFLTSSMILHNENEQVGGVLAKATETICHALNVDVETLQKEQAFPIFDMLLYVSAYVVGVTLAIAASKREEKK